MKNIAVFASGKGTNFSALVKAVKKGRIKANLPLLICDNKDAYVIKRARQLDVKVALVKREDFATREDFENRLIQHLEENKIDLIVLAGFMRILSKDFVRRYRWCIMNIHPALLPSFKGTKAIEDAFKYGVKVTGVTVHFVDERMDHGPIILQSPVKIEKTDTLKTLEAKVHRTEHRLYPEAIRLFLEGRLEVKGRKVRI
jgi:phosphoribosylglycinamide formyltransferase-1